MRRRITSVTFAILAALAVAGCGEDSNDNHGVVPSPTAVRTSTPVVTPPGPVPTATPIDGDGCEADQLSITVTSAPGSDLDTGWTGIAHNSVAIEQASVTTNLNNCANGVCDVDGSNLVGTKFGSPLPLSSGGVPVCVTNTFREAVTGTYECATGCASSEVRITSSVFLVQDIAKPCPLCNGDPTFNDGQKGGSCDGGATPGAACDVGGVSAVFGPTSNDCLPSGTAVSDLAINLSPLTTGTVTQTASIPCRAAGSQAPCYCDDGTPSGTQGRPNACDDGLCPADGSCDSPIDAFCSGQRFRACTSGSGTADCEANFPGAGSCIDEPRPCFGNTITRTGTCALPGQTGTLVAFFCIPRVAAAAINTTAGLPGPGVLSLPVTSLRVPR